MDQTIINNIKSLGIDMIHEAGSGHPGIVLGAAPILYTLYQYHMNVNPNEPKWMNRDRFVMSAGHGSALLYATLFMAGFNLSIDDMKQFRRLDSKTPGHPEYGITAGVDMSTGPLGQGFASAVGMALGSKILESKYVFPGKKRIEEEIPLFDYKVYVLAGDGDLMEGISYEAASLAGTLKLNNLIVLYDSNDISLDGKTSNTFTEDIPGRFEAMGWNVSVVKDGLSVSDINKAISRAKGSSKPTLIQVKTIIGKDSLQEGSHKVHGSLLDQVDLDQLRGKLGHDHSPFYVNEEAHNQMKQTILTRGMAKYELFNEQYQAYINDIPNTDMITYLDQPQQNFDVLNLNWNMEEFVSEATRISNEKVLNHIAKQMDYLIGGSADLASSTKAYIHGGNDISANQYLGKNISFGVREHAMGAILNGLALTNFKVFGSTFLSFADYVKPAIRLSALMGLPVNYIFTHDAINIGGDGPTHQPVEQLAMLRATPNLNVYRPADANEVIGCYQMLLNTHYTPSALILSRSDVPQLSTSSKEKTTCGAYVVRYEQEHLHGIVIATGSEVSLALQLAEELYSNNGIDIRVISMPCMEIYLKQPKEYKDRLLPLSYKKIVIEAGSSAGWHQFVYNENYLITVDSFGYSGTSKEVLAECNFDYDSIKERIIKLVK